MKTRGQKRTTDSKTEDKLKVEETGNTSDSTSSLDSETNITKMAVSVPTSFTIEVFDEAKSTFERWLQRLESAFIIFAITDGKLKTHFLLHYVGSQVYDFVCDSVAPDAVKDKSYEEIVKILKDYYNPKPLEVAEYYKFHHRHQQEGETVKEYVAALRKMAVNCNFGEYLLTALRNQLVCGVRAKKIRDRLLETKDLNFTNAVEIAVSLESTQEKSAQMDGNTGNVYRVDRKNYSKGGKYKNGLVNNYNKGNLNKFFFQPTSS